MLELVFQHLKPCMHLMTSQLKLLNDFDPYCQNVEKFLLLTPMCCLQSNVSRTNIDSKSPRTSVSSMDSKIMSVTNWNHHGNQLAESLYGNYHAYLCDARNKIASCKIACCSWSNKYNGRESSKTNGKRQDVLEEFEALLATNNVSQKNYLCKMNDNCAAGKTVFIYIISMLFSTNCVGFAFR